MTLAAPQKAQKLREFALQRFHAEQGARFFEFAGWRAPLHYEHGIIAEHLHTRRLASLFDISHMAQFRLVGPGVDKVLERLSPADISGLDIGAQRYVPFTNSGGGISDDLIVSRLTEAEFHVAANAAYAEQDFELIRAALNPKQTCCLLSDHVLLAVQGPLAEDVVADIWPQCRQLFFMHFCSAQFEGAECLLSRSGYSGEDGFELSAPKSVAAALVNRLLRREELQLAGFGARDTLRLEAGLPLNGHDLSPDITLVEAGLGWSVGKRRAAAGDFPGAKTILTQLQHGVERQRIGLIAQGRAPLRRDQQLADESGEVLGAISSGGYSPSLEAPLAMAYLPAAARVPEVSLFALQSQRVSPVRIVELPFLSPRYRRARTGKTS